MTRRRLVILAHWSIAFLLAVLLIEESTASHTALFDGALRTIAPRALHGLL